MAFNYLKLAFRNLLRQKGYSFINIAGLAIGLLCCLFIVLFISDELSYDSFNIQAKKTYRVLVTYKNSNNEGRPIPIQPYRLREALLTEFPGIKSITRVGEPFESQLEFNDTKQRIMATNIDDDFFNIFTIQMIEGDQRTALEGPTSIIINETTAKKMFGNEEAVGKLVNLYAGDEKYPIQISGVFKDIPDNSHFHVDAFFSTRITDHLYNNRQLNNWGESVCYVYLLMPDNMTPQTLESRFPSFVDKVRGEGSSKFIQYSLQPLLDIHLHSNLRFELEPNSDIRYIYIFGAIAIFILLIAAFNYMNLSTARSIRRSKEVGIRKANGARRGQLILQFTGEAVFFSFLAMWIALLLAELLMPYFNNLSGKNLDINLLNNWKILLVLFGTSVLTGILAGSYPAFFLSGFKPVHALYGNIRLGSGNIRLRKALVILQFSISILLIICTLTIYSQWNYMKNARLGIEPDNVVIVNMPDHYRTFKDEILKNPDIISVSASNKKPTKPLSTNLQFEAEGIEPDDNASVKIVTVDWDFFKTMKNEIVKGRSFDRSYGSDESGAFIINETAQKYIGWDDPLGKWFDTATLDSARVNWVEREGRVVGVARDFYFESLHEKIQPVVYFIQENWLNWSEIRLSGQNIPKTIAFIKNTWEIFTPSHEFEYSFYNDDINNLYLSEKKFFSIFMTFAFLAIFIACLGILGLISFTAEQRTKEIGIRKTLGASVNDIIGMLSHEFLFLVLISNVFAWPTAWYFMHNWLQDFPYRTKQDVMIFLASAAMATLISLFATFFQAWRAANANPSISLKHE